MTLSASVASFFRAVTVVRAGAVVGAITIVVGCAAPTVEEEEQGSTESELVKPALACGSTLGANVAKKAKSAEKGTPGSLCYRAVKGHLQHAGVSTASIPSKYTGEAWQFAKWADANPTELAAMGFEKSGISPASAPPGSIIVWQQDRPGKPRAQYGHIEIAVGGGVGCSDFCAKIQGTSEVDVYTPKSCPTKDD